MQPVRSLLSAYLHHDTIKLGKRVKPFSKAYNILSWKAPTGIIKSNSDSLFNTLWDSNIGKSSTMGIHIKLRI